MRKMVKHSEKKGNRNDFRRTSAWILAVVMVLLAMPFAVFVSSAETFRFEKDLGEPKPLSGIRFVSDGETPENVRFFVSDDGVTYYDVNGGSLSTARENVFTSGLDGRGVLTAQYVRVEGTSDDASAVSGKIEVTEGNPDDTILPAGPFPAEGLNENGYGIVRWDKNDVPDGFGINDSESFKSNGKNLNLANAQITVCEPVEENVYRILWNDCNVWSSEELKSMHTRTPEEIEEIDYEDGKIILKEDQIAFVTVSSGRFVAAGDGINSTAKWMLRGMTEGQYMESGEDGFRLLPSYQPSTPEPGPEPDPQPEPDPEPDDKYYQSLKEKLGEEPDDPAYVTDMSLANDGEEIVLTVRVSGFKTEDEICGVYFDVCYDTEAWELIAEYATDLSLECVSGLPSDSWENLSRVFEEEGRIEAAVLNASKQDDTLMSNDELVFEFRFRWKENANDGGAWITHESAIAEKWTTLEKVHGKGGCVSAKPDRSYESELKKLMGEPVEDPAFRIEVDQFSSKDVIAFDLFIKDVKVEAGLSALYIDLHFDPERMELVEVRDTDNSLMCVHNLPEDWENICSYDAEKEPGLIRLDVLNATSKTSVVTDETELVFSLQFRWVNGVTEAGFWIANGDAQAQDWDLNYYDGTGAYGAFEREWTYEDEIASYVGASEDHAFKTEIETERTEDGLAVTLRAGVFNPEYAINALMVGFRYDENMIEFVPGEGGSCMTASQDGWTDECRSEEAGLVTLSAAADAEGQQTLEEADVIEWKLNFKWKPGKEKAGLWVTSDEALAMNAEDDVYTGDGASVVVFPDEEARMKYLVGEKDRNPAFHTEIKAEGRGSDILVEVKVNGFRPEDKVQAFKLELYYDTEELQISPRLKKNTYGFAYVLESVPSADWVSTSMPLTGRVMLSVIVRSEDEVYASEDDEFVFRIPFSRIDGEVRTDEPLRAFWAPHDETSARTADDEVLPGEGGYVLFRDGYSEQISEKAGKQTGELPFDLTLTALPQNEDGTFDAVLKLNNFSPEEAFMTFTADLYYDAERLELATEANELGVLEIVTGLPESKWENWCTADEEGVIELLVMNTGDYAQLVSAGYELEFRLKFRLKEGKTEGGIWIEKDGFKADNWDFVTFYGGGVSAIIHTATELCPPHEFIYMNASAEYLATPADCEHPATYYFSCPWCGEKGEETFEYGKPLGHSGGHATCVSKAVCEHCGKEYGEIDPDGHEYESVYTRPTTKSNGYTTYTCIHCGHSYIEYDDPDTTLKSLLGDVDLNGILNGRDYMLLKRYVLKTASLTDEQIAVADMNGDNKINGLDYLILKRTVLKK